MRLLAQFNIPATSARTWIQYTKDRPFNDKRYAVDGTKLRNLGWQQKTRLEEGLKITVGWYKDFGKAWWGDVESVLTPFPVVKEGQVYADAESRKREATLSLGGMINGASGGSSKKRGLDEEDKENVDGQPTKRIMLGDDLANRNAGAAVK